MAFGLCVLALRPHVSVLLFFSLLENIGQKLQIHTQQGKAYYYPGFYLIKWKLKHQCYLVMWVYFWQKKAVKSCDLVKEILKPLLKHFRTDILSGYVLATFPFLTAQQGMLNITALHGN